MPPNIRRSLALLPIAALALAAASAPAAELASVDAAPAPTTAETVAVSAAGSADESTPQNVVSTLQSALLRAMQGSKELGFDGRYELLQPVVGETFDVAFMGAKCVGRHWKKLTPEEQAAWLGQFEGYLTANYAGNFKDFDGETFEVVGEQPAARDTRVVLTKLRVPGADDVVLNYRLHRGRDGAWRIIDIYLKGTVSELALRRSDFAATLKEKGFEELTAAMDKKIADLRKKGS